MSTKNIHIQGARTHNLKNIDIRIPRNELTVITGLSGSGKSSLAFDTLYAEGQRRYVESLSSYARQFLSMMEKPDVEHIEGLSPAISIDQKATSHNPRSTVGTVTEIYDYLRLLYARVGVPRCPEHHKELDAQSISQMCDHVSQLTPGSKIMILAPVVQNRKGEQKALFNQLRGQGFIRVRINGDVFELDDLPTLAPRQKHDIEVVIDRLVVKENLNRRLAESFEVATRIGEGLAVVSFMEGKKEDILFSRNFSCPECGYCLEGLEPQYFSFNNPKGACESCDGLGYTQYFDETKVVSDTSLSIMSGAIKGWDKRNFYYFSMLSSLAEHFGFDLDKPFKKLSKKIKNIIFYGSGDEDIEFSYHTSSGNVFVREHPFEGIIPNITRRYHETDSASTRDELSKYMAFANCKECGGDRLNEKYRNVFIKSESLPDVCRLSIANAMKHFNKLKLKGNRAKIAEKILKEITDRLQFLLSVGLDYLTLSRSADTLSGGEAQRIRLASQIGSGLVGVTYVLDEPSIGLHQRDNEKLLNTLTHLRDLGNTVIVVEHDEDAIRRADHIIDIGPGAGIHGGEVVAEGSLKQVMKSKRSMTGRYLSGTESIALPTSRRVFDKERVIELTGVTCNNLENTSVEIPIGLFTCITGVSGSGKSSLINSTLFPIASHMLNNSDKSPKGSYEEITGLEHLDKVIDIDQSPIGRTPRSNPATYTGIFTIVRDLFTGTQEARSRGYKPGRFSFNVKGGRCEACQGDGVIKVEMHFLADIYVECDVCKGKRYNRETLEVTYKNKNIHDILNMTVEDASEFFDAIPALKRKLQTLIDVGLGYIKLGQSAISLSGGEAQRVKLAKELSRKDTGRTLYILDEPTTGLHFHDIKQLLNILHTFCDHGNTVVIIEHNLDVIKTSDWVVDLGPEGGEKGGRIIAKGTPEKVAEKKGSYTGHFLAPLLDQKMTSRKRAKA